MKFGSAGRVWPKPVFFIYLKDRRLTNTKLQAIMLNKIVLDLETQKSFDEVGGRNKFHLLKVSVAVAYSYVENKFLVFEERSLHKLGELLQEADLVIGYNVLHFDYEVLRPYLHFDPQTLPTLDLLVEVEKVLGHRIGLESLANATLNTSKLASGMDAITYWRTKQMDKLKAYCTEDVKITRDIYNYALENKKLFFSDFFTKKEIRLEFPEVVPAGDKRKQTSLF
jgi:DEAD/DEAH box helicase domain-containing protein